MSHYIQMILQWKNPLDIQPTVMKGHHSDNNNLAILTYIDTATVSKR